MNHFGALFGFLLACGVAYWWLFNSSRGHAFREEVKNRRFFDDPFSWKLAAKFPEWPLFIFLTPILVLFFALLFG